MSEPAANERYRVRDQQGNAYGPADAEMLRAWVREGRIVAGMWIAAMETETWVEASVHPAVADLLLMAPPQAPVSRPSTPAAPSKSVTTTMEAAREASQSPTDESPKAIQPRRDEQVLQRAADRLGVDPEVLRSMRPQDPNEEILYAPPAQQNVPGIISFIAGLLGLVLMPCCITIPLSGLLGIAAIVLGIVALTQMRADPARYLSRGYAISGVTLGGVTLLLALGAALLVTFRTMTMP
jgi:hypothetical protein